jgi:two-component system nitrogen regulation sensor histidine kinase NtrY
MIKNLLKKYYVLIAAVVCSITFGIYYFSVHSHGNSERAYQSFQHDFHAKQDLLDKELDFFKKSIAYKSVDEIWSQHDNRTPMNFHVYSDTTLVYWNTNQLPILRFAEIHFPEDGILHLQNGWYFAKTMIVEDYKVCGSFLIKQDYSYENGELVNAFSSDLELPFTASLSIDEEQGYQINMKDGSFAFSVVQDEVQLITRSESVLLFLLLITSIALWLAILIKVTRRLPVKFQFVVPLGIIALRYLSIQLEWFGFMEGTEVYTPSLYATDNLFPNFVEYAINVSVIVYIMHELRQVLSLLKKGRVGKFIAAGFFISSVAWWELLVHLLHGLIEDSSIPLIIDQLFELNIYSIFAIASVGFFIYGFYLFVRDSIVKCKELGWTAVHMAMIVFFGSCFFLFYEINEGNDLSFNGLFPALLYGLMVYLIYRFDGIKQLGAGLILLLLFSLITAANIADFNQKRERSERELYANQLATEKNIVTEAEYFQLSNEIKEDKFLQSFIGSPQAISLSTFQEGMERRLFNGYWERYEMSFSLFDADKKPLIEYRKDPDALYNELQSIIDKSGVPSELDPNIYFISDYSGQYSYIIKQPLTSEDTTATAVLFATLKSKKIPEEIGFPRLLISEQTNVLERLEAYSIAKYHNGRLVTKYGDFNYPSSHHAILPKTIKKEGYFDFGEFNHYALKMDGNDVVILSSKHFKAIDLITSFSYLFSFFGLLLLPLLFRFNASQSTRKTFSLAMKIQLVLISLVFLSLLAFGWGSGVFVSNQYNQYTDDVIREKLNSVQTEVRAKLGDFEELSIDENGNYVQYILQKFAKVFYTDINLYDNEGYLLGTSRPKVFNVGLLSEQMNPFAYQQMKFNQISEFVHDESIGELDYSSAYLPFYNKKGNRLGFINLQHFGQQREFENQIQKFMVAIINVFILLLAISIVLAIFISAWLTSPLRILQESFASVKFGKYNEQISYDREDEIGALVKDYNQKLLELEFAAQQLAKSERESAWREMAKQVAHEIKNPLTPMKLSVQQLLRVYDPDDPKSGEKLQKVANSMIEQIDALTNIANEFSSFAKMPNPLESRFDLVSLIRGVAEVFRGQGKVEFNIQVNPDEIFVLADKDQFVRVFNNLIKNAIQAIPADRAGKISIDITQKDKKVEVKITDNGVGIDPSKVGKIFVPYFTTKSTGTGLGLAMVKQIIENHQGTIDFETELGVGTTFEVVLPVANAE